MFFRAAFIALNALLGVRFPLPFPPDPLEPFELREPDRLPRGDPLGVVPLEVGRPLASSVECLCPCGHLFPLHFPV